MKPRSRPRYMVAGFQARIESLNDVPASPDQDFLCRLIEDLRGKQEAIPSEDFSEIQFIVIADAASPRMLFRYVNDGKHVVIAYTTVEMTDSGRRLPEGYDVLSDKKVGVVGCGSLGSKIAASLTRCGISRFVLVDEDIFCTGQLVRHEPTLTAPCNAQGTRS